MFKSVPSMSKEDRRRGRPTGKNRIPLSLEERRARNAQYERERRNETADAMTQLAEAAGCDPQISNADLLATVVSRLQRASKKSDDLEDIKRINNKLESQIEMLLSRLGNDVNLDEIELDETDQDADSEQSSSVKTDSGCDDIVLKRPRKYRKKARNNTIHDKYQSETESTSSSDTSEDQQSSCSASRTESRQENNAPCEYIRSRQENNAPCEEIDVNIEDLIKDVVDTHGIQLEDIIPHVPDSNGANEPALENLDESDKRLFTELFDRDIFSGEQALTIPTQETNWPLDFNDFINGF